MKSQFYNMPKNVTFDQLQNWIRIFLITDNELKSLPAGLVEQLGRHYRERWIKINLEYYS